MFVLIIKVTLVIAEIIQSINERKRKQWPSPFTWVLTSKSISLSLFLTMIIRHAHFGKWKTLGCSWQKTNLNWLEQGLIYWLMELIELIDSNSVSLCLSPRLSQVWFCLCKKALFMVHKMATSNPHSSLHFSNPSWESLFQGLYSNPRANSDWLCWGHISVLGPITMARLMEQSDWPTWVAAGTASRASTSRVGEGRGSPNVLEGRKDEKECWETKNWGTPPVCCLLCGVGNSSRIGARTASSPWCSLIQLSHSSVPLSCLHLIFFKVKKALGLVKWSIMWRIQTLTT